MQKFHTRFTARERNFWQQCPNAAARSSAAMPQRGGDAAQSQLLRLVATPNCIKDIILMEEYNGLTKVVLVESRIESSSAASFANRLLTLKMSALYFYAQEVC